MTLTRETIASRMPSCLQGGRDDVGMVAAIKSEWWPASNRNGGRDQVGISGRLASESAFLTRARHELNILVHIIFPIISTVALFLVLYYSLVPLPAPPVSYAPLIGLVLFVAGLAVLWKLHSRRDSGWKTLSEYIVDADTTPSVDPGKVAAPISVR